MTSPLSVLGTAGALLLLLVGCGAAPVASQVAATRSTATALGKLNVAIAGDWTMDLRIGEKTFHDTFRLESDGAGGLKGSLTVPGNFTAPLEKIGRHGNHLVFEILADEKPTPFRVRYEGTLTTDGRSYSGKASLPANQSLLGTFLARRTN